MSDIENNVGFKELVSGAFCVVVHNWFWLAAAIALRLFVPVGCAAASIMLLSQLKATALIIGALVGLGLWIYIDYGIIRLLIDLAAGKKGNPFSFLSPPSKELLNFAIVYVLVVLGFIVGSVLLVVPGIYFLSRFSVAVPLVIVERKSPLDALKSCLKLSKGSVKALLGITVISTACTMLLDAFSIILFFWTAVSYFLARKVLDAPKPTKPHAFKILSAFIGLPLTLYASVLLALVPMHSFIEARYIPSSAMEPTLNIDDRIIVEKSIGFGLKKPKHGDIVLFYPPPSELPGKKDLSYDVASVLGRATGLPFLPYEPVFIKRVIGNEGDTIKVVKGEGVYLNGRLLFEHYVKEPPAYDLRVMGDIGMTGRMAYEGRPNLSPQEAGNPIVVGPNQVFVLGDNRNNSQDSHVWGFLDSKRVVGRAWLKYLPTQTFFEANPAIR